MTLTNRNFDLILKAKSAASWSNCTRRKIGVAIPYNDPDDSSEEIAIAANTTQKTDQCCTRSAGPCPAIHAEVNAILNLGLSRYLAEELYIWAEVPCHQCLSFIHKQTYIREIFCLSPESYGKEYPRVLDRTSEIQLRYAYADSLGIDVHKLDAEEILEYELSTRLSNKSS